MISVGDMVRHPGLPDFVGKVKEVNGDSVKVEFPGGGLLRTIKQAHTEAVVYCECCDGTGWAAKYEEGG